MNKPILIICVMTLFFYQISESLAATTCAWEKDADGNDTTKLIISGSGAFTDCGDDVKFSGWKDKVTNVEIKDGVNSIGNDSFSNCRKISEVSIPNSVKSIGSNAFAWTLALKNIDIPRGVTSIENQAFIYSGLENISLPSTLTSLGGGAFYSSRLKNIIIPESVMNISSAAFYGTNATITIPDSWSDIKDKTKLGINGMTFFNLGANAKVYCQGFLEKCQEALAKAICKNSCPSGLTCSSSSPFCLNGDKIVAIDEQTSDRCDGKYIWKNNSCQKRNERECNSYRDDFGVRQYYYNGVSCVPLPADEKVLCLSKSYKANDGYCDRVRYTPAEAAAVANDDNTNVVTITFRKQ